MVPFDSVLWYQQECVRSTTPEWPGLMSLSAPTPPVQSLCTGPTPCTCVRTPNSGTSYYYIISRNHPSFSNYLKIGNKQFVSTLAIFCSFNVIRSCLLRIKKGNHSTGPEVRFSFFHVKDNFNFIDWLDIYEILRKMHLFCEYDSQTNSSDHDWTEGLGDVRVPDKQHNKGTWHRQWQHWTIEESWWGGEHQPHCGGVNSWGTSGPCGTRGPCSCIFLQKTHETQSEQTRR